MNITLIILALILFAAIYASKRRYGLLALALVAGSIVSASWTAYVTLSLQMQGIKLLSPPLNVVVAIVLILLPAVFLLIAGPKYNKSMQRIIGSLLCALLGTLLIVVAIVREAPDLMAGNQTGMIVTDVYALVIVIGVALAIIDTVMAHLPKKRKNSGD